ncbi:hypothetical protein D9M69_530130 [compost metagenome]
MPYWPSSSASRSPARGTTIPSLKGDGVTPRPAGPKMPLMAPIWPGLLVSTARFWSQPSAITSGWAKKVPQLSTTVWSHSSW